MTACRPGCGACCIAPSISPAPPALPRGKPAGVRCPHLTDDVRCALWGRPERPAVCGGIQPAPAMCGDSAEQAMATLVAWERLTAPRSGEGAGAVERREVDDLDLAVGEAHRA